MVYCDSPYTCIGGTFIGHDHRNAVISCRYQPSLRASEHKSYYVH